MSVNQMITGTCPKCGENLEIPAHLKQFSCLYCGQRLTMDDIVPPVKAVSTEQTDAIAAVEFYKAHVLESIANHTGLEAEISGSTFQPAFAGYMEANADIFRNLDVAVRFGAITPDEAAAHFLTQLEQRWNEKGSKRAAKKMMELDKFIVAIYLVPMIRKLGLSVSEDFCAALQAQWVAKYPDSPFYLGTYEELCSGFQKKFLGLCYITTAICSHDGKPDNCDELTAFRNFRDGYLRSCPDGPALISEYYDVAPGIVMRIELSEDRDAKYAAIRDNYLMPCYADLQAGNLKSCKNRYVEMVRALEKEYLS